MEMFDIGIVKREPVEDFHTDPNYLDHIMPYSSDVLDAPADWFTGFVDDRSSVQSMDQLGHVLDYPNVDLDCMSRGQTLNRLNGITLNQRAYHDDFATPTAFSPYATSPVSPDFDHRLEVNSQEIDYDMKSFYSGQQFRAPGINHGDHVVDFNVEMEKAETLKDEVAVPINLEEDDALRSSGESDQDRDDSESGYDSGAHSPTSETPCTPRSLMLSQVDNDGSSSSTGEVTPPCEQPQNRQPFFLSEEEKRTLITEGLPIPAGYPLTKSEERALKKVRRKIKNKISAQESRRKKKEYMETLEKRVEMCSSENFELRKQLESMETANRSLISQLQKLQAIVASRVTRPTCANSTQTTDEASI